MPAKKRPGQRNWRTRSKGFDGTEDTCEPCSNLRPPSRRRHWRNTRGEICRPNWRNSHRNGATQSASRSEEVHWERGTSSTVAASQGEDDEASVRILSISPADGLEYLAG